MNKLQKIILFTMFFTLSTFLCASNTYEGTIKENGFGKFIMTLEDGADVLIYVGKKETFYEPLDWRQDVGDKVAVSYIKTMGRSAEKIVATKIKLLEINEAMKNFKSPLEVQIIKTGRKNIMAQPLGMDQAFTFEKNRKTQIVPSGWMPNPGDSAIITFERIPARIGFNMVNVIKKMEKK